MKTTTKTDNRSLTKLAKDIATMRRKVAAMVKRHEKLQQRIQHLVENDRITFLFRQDEIVQGRGDVWFVKADSLNTAGSKWNWYYTVIFDEQYNAYQCSCEDVRHCDCKHAVKLGQMFERDAHRTAYVAVFDPHMIAC